MRLSLLTEEKKYADELSDHIYNFVNKICEFADKHEENRNETIRFAVQILIELESDEEFKAAVTGDAPKYIPGE